MATFPIITKRAFEHRIFEINLAPRMRPSDVIREVTDYLVDSAITITRIAHTATTCQFLAEGGASGQIYPVLIQFETEASDPEPPQRLEAEVHLQIVRGAEVESE